MSIQSMTGYASKSIIIEPNNFNRVKLTISIKSLNSRYFDINCKMPYVLNQYETDFIKLIKSKLYRGHVYLVLHLDDQNAFKTAIEPSIATISGYMKAIDKIKEKIDITGNITISDLFRLPNIFTLEEKGIDQKSKDQIFNVIEELLKELINERTKEGNYLKQDIQERIKLIESKIKQISNTFEKYFEEQKEKISKKIHEINEGANIEFAQTNRQALYLTLDKIDIHEEITRFNTHLDNFINFLNSQTQEKGKQLDFILQELSREINTLTAKTPNAKIIDLAISIKVEIEKMREQAQNIV